MSFVSYADWLSYDPERRILTIDGIHFDREIFEWLGKGAVGTVAKIDSRADGTVVLTRIEEPLTRQEIVERMVERSWEGGA